MRLTSAHLAIDQQDRIWVSNAAGGFVTRFAAADPTKVETFKAGYSGSGVNVDSQGNAWVTNRLGSAQRGKAALEEFQNILKTSYNDEYLVRTVSKQRGGADGGSVALAAGRQRISRLTVHGRRIARAMGCCCGR